MKSKPLTHAALLLIDVINPMDFPGGDSLVRQALPAASKIASLRRRLTDKGVPVIYVNDNFGEWQSDFSEQVRRCTRPDCPACEVAGRLLPGKGDYFVLKPKHSGFYSTSLDVLLQYLGVHTLVLTGFAADICVLYTANDAYMRDYAIVVPSDCVASESAALRKAALEQMVTRLKARVCLSRYVR